ncbi:MAG: SDR family NAD(P)-dependent oxidoreductase [Acidimicrobiaceae bacterium]|nr:SDR family NAD(P)-dependent oxidoreductase [Acidimicrobiaceae bacterium]
MPAQIEGQPVVVTGGGNGIGAALALNAAARRASTVAIVDVNEEAAASVAAQITANGSSATVHMCDVSDAVAVDALADQLIAAHGLPGLAIANAGVMVPMRPLLETAPADIEWLVGVNLRGVIHTMQSFGRPMVASEQGGWLLVTASEHALGVPHLYGAPYTASKHAVLGACDVLRSELPAHVGVSVLCPGLTASRLWNSTAVRPDEFGGALSGDPQSGTFMEATGMPAATVAERALDGAEAGHFLIPTHYNARAYAESRAAEVTEAFDRLAEIDTTDYDVGALAARMLEQLAATEEQTD